jgi:hypothetical protein
MTEIKQTSCALAQADRRLCDGLNLLVETKMKYFAPDSFRLSLNNTVQTLRNVTFVLQKVKFTLPGFDEWYTGWQKTMRADRLLRWLVEARNIIVKQGDLETNSVARISIVDSWFDPPKCEIVVPPFTLTEEFAHHLSTCVPAGIPWDMGLLRVERRWVHDQMPQEEILDSLVHSFDVLSKLLFDAHNVLFDQSSREACPWYAISKDAEGRLPPCMVAQDWDRTVWVDLHDGALMRPVSIPMDQSEDDLGRVAERYPGAKDLKGKLSPASSLQEEAAVWFEQAKNILRTDGYHLPTALIGYRDGKKTISQLHMEDRTAKHLMLRKLAAEIEKTGATSVILINEAWLSRGHKPPPSGHAVDDPNREEALQLIATDASGGTFVHTAVFVRDAQGSIQFTQESTSTTDIINLLQPY